MSRRATVYAVRTLAPVPTHAPAFALAAALATAAITTPREASAQSSQSAGDARFDRAVAAFQAQDYATALGLFQQLYIDTRNPALLFNIGQAQDRLHHPDEAARALRQFLRLVPEAPNRADIETQLHRLDAEVAAAGGGSGPGGTGAGTGTGTGATGTGTGTSGGGASGGSASPAGPPALPPPVDSRPVWPLAVAGVGLLSGIAGGILLGIGASQIGGAQNAMTERDYQSAVDGGNGLQTGGWITLGVGVALLGVGAVAYLVSGPSQSEHAANHAGRAHARVAPGWAPVPGGGMMTLTVVGF